MDKIYLTVLISFSAILAVMLTITLIKSKKCSLNLKNKIEENNDRFRLIFDGVNDALIIHDIEGRILDANKRALDMYGLSKNDLGNISIIGNLSGPNHSSERLKKIWKQVIDGETAIFPWVANKKDTEETFEVEVGLRKILVPDQTLILATIRDMTEYNNAAAEIRRLAAVVEQVDESVIVCDRDARIIYVNPFFEKTSGYSALEVLGENLGILKSGAHDNQFYKCMWETLNSGENWHGTLSNRKKDGSILEEQATIFPIRGYKSEITGYAAVKRDITQKMSDDLALKSAKDSADKVNMELESAIAAANAMSEKAIEASQAKSEFIASVSHELRTPLNIIVGSIELMAETSLDNDQSKYLRVCRNACESLLEIISGILDISKIEAGQLSIESVEFEPRTIINDIMLLNEFRAKSKNIELVSEISDDISENIMGDPARIRQILINLVNNAIKFTEKGEVRIKVEKVPNTTSASSNNIFLKFSVIDTGIGISPENIDRIFDEFIQADTSITKKFGGTGLGLTISKKLVNLMGGDIWAESREGEGSSFIFTIRCNKTDSEEKKITVQRMRKTPSMPEKRLKILLAEDIADNRLLITKMISQIADVETAENGAQAVEKFRSGIFDIVIMDIQMPELDGYTAAKMIRQIEAEENRHETPLIALTAFATSEELKKSIEAGFSGHVTKPVKKATLLDTICITIQEHFSKNGSQEENLASDNEESILDSGKNPRDIHEKDYIVTVDPAIEELIPFFMENRKDDLIKLGNAIKENDFATIMRLGHSFKGTGGSYGFHLISKKGAELEEAASAKDTGLLSKLKDQLSDYLERVHVRFE